MAQRQEPAAEGGSPGRRTCCPRCLAHASLNGPRRKVLERLASALREVGFEIESRVSLSDLARERLGIEAPTLEVLHLQQPLLLLQCLLADGDPALLFPPIVIVRARGESIEACLRTAWGEGDRTMSGLAEELVKRTNERLRRALESLILQSGGRK